MSAPIASPSARADRGGPERSDDDAVPTAFVRADRQRAKDREHSGPNECALAERVAAHGDLANGVAREALLTGIGLDGDLIAREAREAPSGLDPQLIRNLKLIVEVDSKREVFEGLKCLSRASRRCQQHEGKERDDNRSAHPQHRETFDPSVRGRSDAVHNDVHSGMQKASQGRTDSPAPLAMMCRVSSRSRTISCHSCAFGTSGVPIVTSMRARRNSHVPSGSTLRVPRSAMGTTGRVVSTAALNAPRRNGRSPGGRKNVPSGKISNCRPSRRSCVSVSAPESCSVIVAFSMVMCPAL